MSLDMNNPKLRARAEARLLKSGKFRKWRPKRHVFMSRDVQGSLITASMAEKHYAPDELAELWGVHPETIRNIFREESGVLKIGDKNPKHKRSYITIRIPVSVAERVHKRLSE
jgi:hypothetical protein